MNFRTAYQRERRSAHIGSPVKELYTASYDKNGVLQLEPNGYKDIYSEIQTHKDSCSIKAILKRYQDGDASALNRAQTMFMDVTETPKNLAEMLNLVTRAETEFNSLPVEIRSNFGHNFGAWMATAGTEGWLQSMGISVKENNDTPIPEEVNKDA